ncbi:hypothetical protein ACNUDN_03788 [Mycobacterium sp. smrl_JER01]
MNPGLGKTDRGLRIGGSDRDIEVATRLVRAGHNVDVLHRCHQAGPQPDASTTPEYVNS